MTTNDESPRHEAAFFTTIRSWGITRGEHGVFGGVVEGVGDRIGLDRLPARIIAVILLFLTQGFFFALYAAAWALLPDRSGRIVIQDFGRGTPNVGALIMIAIFATLGLNANPSPWSVRGDWGRLPFGGLWALIPLGIAIGAIVLVIVLITRSNKPPSAQGPMAIPPQRASAAAAPTGGTYAAAPGAVPTGPGSAKAARSAAAATQGSSTAIPLSGGTGDAAAPRQVPSTPTPPPPPRPRTPGPGSAIYLLTLSAAVFAAAAIWLLDREGRLDVSPVVAWCAVAVLIIGAGIILAGAAGRRVGFFGFLAWTFIVGWLIGLTIVPRAFEFADGGATITIDGITHTIGNGHGWFDQETDGVSCGPYKASVGAAVPASAAVLTAGPSVFTMVEGDAAIVEIPSGASVTFHADEPFSGSISWEAQNVTCDFERATGDLYSALRTGDGVIVNIGADHSAIVVKEN